MSRELTTTYRDGRLLAAYLHLQKRSGTPVSRSKREPNGVVVDFSADGEPLGLEFIAPSKLSLAGVNDILQAVGQAAASADELWPILRKQATETSAA
jgi:hypothetical protein